MSLPLILGGVSVLALALKNRNTGAPTAPASASVNTSLLGTGSVTQAAPVAPASPGVGGQGVGGNTTPIEILQLPPEISAGRYGTPLTAYFPAGFSGQISPVSSLPMTPAAGVKISGGQMTGTVGAPTQGVFMEGPVYTQRGTPSTPVGAYSLAEVSRPASLPTGAASPTSAAPLVNPYVPGPVSSAVQQTTAAI